jgi:hypothetical protein
MKNMRAFMQVFRSNQDFASLKVVYSIRPTHRRRLDPAPVHEDDLRQVIRRTTLHFDAVIYSGLPL